MMMMGNMGGSDPSSSMGMMNMGGGSGSSMGMNMGNMQGMGGQMPMNTMPGMYDPSAMGGMANHGAQMSGSGLGDIFGGILTLTIELLMLFLVIGLVVGIVVMLKRFIIDGDLFTTKVKRVCTNCGINLDPRWNCCPHCGTVKVNNNGSGTTPQTV